MPRICSHIPKIALELGAFGKYTRWAFANLMEDVCTIAGVAKAMLTTESAGVADRELIVADPALI